MTMDFVRGFLGWCTLINFGILLYWFLAFTLARDRIYRFMAGGSGCPRNNSTPSTIAAWRSL